MAKHARASAVTVRLSGSGEILEFSVSDDGAGFPAAAARHGSGLQGSLQSYGWPRTAAPWPSAPSPGQGTGHNRPPPHIGADERSRALPGQPG